MVSRLAALAHSISHYLSEHIFPGSAALAFGFFYQLNRVRPRWDFIHLLLADQSRVLCIFLAGNTVGTLQTKGSFAGSAWALRAVSLYVSPHDLLFTHFNCGSAHFTVVQQLIKTHTECTGWTGAATPPTLNHASAPIVRRMTKSLIR